MAEEISMKVIARLRSGFSTKFGLPRQSGLAPSLPGRVEFEPEFRDPEALRGLEGFSHLWLVWQFSRAVRPGWSPTVRPPRLGGNTRMGVFATRSPFRPNPIGLSCVELAGVEYAAPCGPVLHVLGADLMDGTPILDIKPYLPYADCRPGALEGFAPRPDAPLQVECPPEELEKLPRDARAGLLEALSFDPRPAYRPDGERVYGLSFAGREVRFTVSSGVLRVEEVR